MTAKHGSLDDLLFALLLMALVVASSVIVMVWSAPAKDQRKCMQLLFLSTEWTDHRPEVAVNMTFGANGSIYSITNVTKPIMHPVSVVTLSQDVNGRMTTLYNITNKLCDFEKVMNRMPIVKTLMESSLGGDNSNYTLSCPVKRGLYTMYVHIDERNRLLSYIYKPNVQFLLRGGLFDGLKNGTLEPMSTYDVTMRLLKRACNKGKNVTTKV